MKIKLILLIIIFLNCTPGWCQKKKTALIETPYKELPLGAIRPEGWLKEMLLRQKSGATGNLDEWYALVMGSGNGWLGGDGDQWERGPYWIDGLVPLAYLLNDSALIAKTKPWIEWTLGSQKSDGYFGPSKDYPNKPGVQRDNSRDWWPKMVMLKVFQQYYSATGDNRVIPFLTKYFRYQLATLPSKPLDHWTSWARYRAGDNLQVIYWLYRITGDSFLIDLGELIHRQTFNYTRAFEEGVLLSTPGSIHGVNLAQGIKEPAIYYQRHPEKKYLDALKKGFADLYRFNGMAHGMYGADEALHGNNPTQGSELCSAVEMMFSLESILAITGDLNYADQLERIAFNALPAQITSDWSGRQYFQQANQVMCTRHIRNFDINHEGTDICYGLLTGYPCCTANMHQGWPKFTQNLWYCTSNGGVAAIVYAPSEATLNVAGNVPVTIKEETNYPFEETIRFKIKTKQKVQFPFSLRVPGWCKNAVVKVNGKLRKKAPAGTTIQIDRLWDDGDLVELELPMHIYKNNWYEKSISIERGPLVYVLKMKEQMTAVQNKNDSVAYGKMYHTVTSPSAWNYGLADSRDSLLQKQYIVRKISNVKDDPWTQNTAPLMIETKAYRIPSWKIYNEMTGPMPYSVTYRMEFDKKPEMIQLIPYGCSRIRISQFPLLAVPQP